MKVRCLARGYASFGASILTSAADHLELSLEEIAPADLFLEITAFLRHEEPPRLTLESRLARHKANFPENVRVRHRAKAGVFHIDYPSELHEDESFARPGGIYAVAHILPKALDELSAAVIDGLRARPAVWKTLNVSQLEEAISKAKANLPSDPDKIAHYMRTMMEARKSAAKAPTSVDELEIDWKQFHPSARMKLNNTFFWSEVDDDAPHGNDTGSDLFAAFQRWQRRNLTASYEGYVDRLMARWGFTSSRAQAQLSTEQLVWIRCEADIALAFGAIKLRGMVEQPAKEAALTAIESKLRTLSDNAERTSKLVLLRDALQSERQATST